MSAEVLGGILLALGVGSILTELVRSWLNRGRNKTSEEIQKSDNALKWAEHALSRAVAAENRADGARKSADDAWRAAERCRSRMRLLESHIERLEDIMRAARLDAPPMPADDTEEVR